MDSPIEHVSDTALWVTAARTYALAARRLANERVKMLAPHLDEKNAAPAGGERGAIWLFRRQ